MTSDTGTGTGINGWIRVTLPLDTIQRRFCWVEYPPSRIWVDLEDYIVIFAYFRVRFRGEMWPDSSKPIQFYHYPH
jgi:hypothetical protein